ncbi:MAG: hypothetical protein HC902_04995 [Calothrix sp. SM1_5_4]|nr:hypothetical protein [Calothrix sp. SM1_5_4]
MRSGAYPNASLGSFYAVPYTGRDGRLYVVNRHSGRVSRFDYDPTGASGGTVTHLVGNGTRGYCPDGTQALSCPTDVGSVFIDQNGRIYLFDNLMIRTVLPDGSIKTLYGENLNDGVTKLGTELRFTGLTGFDLNRSVTPHRVITIDSGAGRLQELVAGGNIVNIGGDGLNRYPPSIAEPAAGQSVYFKGSGVDSIIAVDSLTGDVFSRQGSTSIHRLIRSTGRWQTLYGSGGTRFDVGDGLAGSAISGVYSAPYGYWNVPLLFGYDGRYLHTLYTGIDWTTVIPRAFMIKRYDVQDSYRQSHFAGDTSDRSWTTSDENYIEKFCTSGPTATCMVGSDAYNPIAKPQWDGTGNRWLLSRSGWNYLLTMEPSGSVGTISLPNTISSFAYMREGGAEIIYYCNASTGRIHKQVIGGGNATLSWPISAMRCTGNTMMVDESRGTLLFMFRLGVLTGLAETNEL